MINITKVNEVKGGHHYNIRYTPFISNTERESDTQIFINDVQSDSHIEHIVRDLLIWNFQEYIRMNKSVHEREGTYIGLKVYFDKLLNALIYFTSNNNVDLKAICDFIIILDSYLIKILPLANNAFYLKYQNNYEKLYKSAAKYAGIWIPLITTN